METRQAWGHCTDNERRNAASRQATILWSGGVSLVKSGDFGDRVVYETSEFLTEEGLASSNAKVFPRGTLCIALYGATVGKLGILGIDAATNQAVCAVFPDESLDTRFLYYFFQGKRRELIEQGKGGAQSNISQGIVRDTLLPLPPLPEQRLIVAETRETIHAAGGGSSSVAAGAGQPERYRAAVLKAACEGRLVPTEAELTRTGNRKATFETGEALLTRNLTERRHWFDRQQADAKTKKKYLEPAKPETANLPSLPDGWTWGTWNQLSNWVTYGFTRPMPHIKEGVPIVTAKGVNKGRIDFDGARPHATALLREAVGERPPTTGRPVDYKGRDDWASRSS